MVNDIHPAPSAGTPAMAWSARLALGLVVAQFALAGAALYASPAVWAAHGAVGSSVLLPVVAMLVHSRQGQGFAHLRPGVWGLLALYLAQVLLAVLSERPEMLALRAAHVGNAALVLCASFWLVLRTRVTRDGLSTASR